MGRQFFKGLSRRRHRAAPAIREALTRMREAGAGIAVYSPQNASFRQKYAGTNQELALQLVGGNGPGDRLRRSSQSSTFISGATALTSPSATSLPPPR